MEKPSDNIITYFLFDNNVTIKFVASMSVKTKKFKKFCCSHGRGGGGRLVYKRRYGACKLTLIDKEFGLVQKNNPKKNHFRTNLMSLILPKQVFSNYFDKLTQSKSD